MPKPPDFSTGILTSHGVEALAREDGESSRVDERDETQQTLADARAATPVGRDEGGAKQDGGGLGWDAPLRIAEVLERFVDSTRTRLKAQTQKAYATEFRQFAERANLEALTKRQLAGPRGKALILAHLTRIPRPTWRWEVAVLKAVWTLGLSLAWPLDAKRDLGNLPKVRRRQSPPDAVVKAWSEALLHERDPYLRLLWLLIAQHGWRSSHVVRLKWRNVQCDEAGKPVAIVADGTEEGFKTNSPIAARLSPDVAEALEAWRQAAPETFSERPILPWADARGRVQPGREKDNGSIRRHWDHLREKWKLPSVRPVDMRHWVASACRRAGLSKQASAYLMGHDPTQGGAMRDWYDAPQLADVLAEQAERVPRGPLGLLEPPEVKLVEGFPPEAIGLLSDYLAGRCGTMEFASRMETLRLRVPVGPPPVPEP